MNKKFKPGDKVVVRHPNERHNLKTGMVYTIKESFTAEESYALTSTDINGVIDLGDNGLGFVTVENDDEQYFAWRFQLAEPATPYDRILEEVRKEVDSGAFFQDRRQSIMR